MTRALYRRLLAWLWDCRVDGCGAPMVMGPVCGRHYDMWYKQMYNTPLEIGDFTAGEWSLRQWVRDVNEQRER